jgi:hypothetical protein
MLATCLCTVGCDGLPIARNKQNKDSSSAALSVAANVETQSYIDAFSSTQGANGWSYKWRDASGNIQNMTWNASKQQWQGNEDYLLLWRGGGHPGNNGDALLEWTAPSNGTARISIPMSDGNATCGDGVTVSVEGKQGSLLSKNIANGNTKTQTFEISQDFLAGEDIRFVINRNKENGCDSTNLNPTVAFSASAAPDVPAAPAVPTAPAPSPTNSQTPVVSTSSSPTINLPGTANTIFGMHDLGGVSYAGITHLPATANMNTAGKKGWVINAFELCTTPGKCALVNGNFYEPLLDKIVADGHGVIVRLDWTYTASNHLGTVPCASETPVFIDRIEQFVKANKIAHVWVIGNEPNLPENQNPSCGLSPQLFANTYRQARERILSLAGHEQDVVMVGAIAPAAESNSLSWLAYYKSTLESIGAGNLGGIALHTYTFSFDPTSSNREQHDPALISSTLQRSDGSFWHFQAYRSMMESVPAWGRSVPVFITETAPWPTWKNINNGWVQKAYEDIANWNKNPGNQKINAMILYRWVNWGGEVAIEDLPEVQQDFIAAMKNTNLQATYSATPASSPVYLATPFAVKPTAATCSCDPDKSNFCLYANDTAGCAMTFSGGYCRPNSTNGTQSSPNWTRGYEDYKAQCGVPKASATCTCLPNVDNFCLYPPSTQGCGMTFPGGYCDSNKNGSFDDADWVRGYEQYASACKKF